MTLRDSCLGSTHGNEPIDGSKTPGNLTVRAAY